MAATPVKEAPKQFTAADLQKEVGKAFDFYNRTFGMSVPIPEISYEVFKEGFSTLSFEGDDKTVMRCTQNKNEIAHEAAHLWAIAAVTSESEKGYLPVLYSVMPVLRQIFRPGQPLSMIDEGFADYLACVYAPEKREVILNKLSPDMTEQEARDTVQKLADSLPAGEREALLSASLEPENFKLAVDAARFASQVARDLLAIHEKYGPAKALEVFLGLDDQTLRFESPEAWDAYLNSKGVA